jgi:hypothetical protein
MPKTKSLMIRSNTLYDTLKYVTQIALPALGTLYFALSQIWGFPNGPEVVGTIVAVTAFLGVLLGISTAQYNQSDAKFDGTINVMETDEKLLISMDYDEDPYLIAEQDEVVFRVCRDKE